MAGRKFKFKSKPTFPVIQGNLAADSLCELCSTGLYKTTFDLISLTTGKIIPCVYWSKLDTFKKGQLVIIEGFMNNNTIICKDIKKIDVPYRF